MSVIDDSDDPTLSNRMRIKAGLAPFGQQLKIGHINCQSMRPSPNSTKIDEIRDLVHENFEIFAVSETWLKPYVSDSSIQLEGYQLVRNDRLHHRGGGVCVYLVRGIRYRIVHKTSSVDCESLFLEILLGGVKILFGVVYLPRGNISAFEDLHYELLLRYSNIITVGDFNCNMFNVVKSNILRSVCTRCGICSYHNSLPTHVSIAHNSTSLLDLWLVSDHSLISFSDQIYCPSISHHSLIFAAFQFVHVESCEFIEYRNFSAIDWNGLLLFLSEYDLSPFLASSDVDFQNSIVNSLISSLYDFVPIVRKRILRNNDNWMRSNTIVLACSLRDLAYSAFLLNRSNENWATYCRYRNRAKSVIRKEKRKFYRGLFSGLDASGMWRLLKGSGCIDGVGWSCHFDSNSVNEFFVSSSAADREPVDFGSSDDIAGSFSFQSVSEYDLFCAICRVKSRSLGTDNIPIRFLKIIYPYVSCILTHHVNTILCTSIFPSAWKVARVVPIPKVKTVRGIDDLRPISILPALSKAVEHIMKDQMLASVRNDIVTSQYAFRRGHSTTSLLLDLTDDIRSALNDHEVATVISLDLSKAFNSVNFNIMIRKLRDNFGFSRTACKLIYSYLANRSQFVVVNGRQSELLCLSSGVPQGSVLGPILFVLYMNDLSSQVNGLGCKSFLFADDIFLLFRGRRLEMDTYQLNISCMLRRFLDWSSLNNLSVNMSKTKALTFGNGNTLLSSSEIFIGSSRILFVDKIKCLGIFLDSRLSFVSHIEHICCRISGILRRLYSVSIYLPSYIRVRIAHALLMPQILYGLEVISGSNVGAISTLRRVLHMIVRFAYGVGRRDHISGFIQRFLGCSFNSYILVRNLYFFYRTIKNGFPVQLCSKFTFSNSLRNPQITIPIINNSLFEKSFLVRIARCWNGLPLELRLFSHSNNVFRLKITSYYRETFS